MKSEELKSGRYKNGDTLDCGVCYLICVNHATFLNKNEEKDNPIDETILNRISISFKNSTCPFNCDFIPKTPGGIIKHMRNCYNCKKCKMTFCGHFAKKKYQSHLNSCLKPKKCLNEIQSQKWQMAKQIIVVQSKEILKNAVNVDIENDEWSNEEKELHGSLQKGLQFEIYKCFFCDEKCNTPSDLHVHLDFAHSEIFPQESFETTEENCEKCDFKCKRKETLKCHNENFHKIEYRKYNALKSTVLKSNVKCDKCNIEFSSKTKHRSHMKEVHEIIISKEKNHFCHLCGKSCPSVFTLKEHITNVHEGIKDHKCVKCGKMYGYKSALQKHIKVAHEGMSTDVVCDLCGKTFTSSYGLKCHIERFHEKKEIERKHVCDTCGKAFTANCLLTDHINYHHKGKAIYSSLQCIFKKIIIWILLKMCQYATKILY